MEVSEEIAFLHSMYVDELKMDGDSAFSLSLEDDDGNSRYSCVLQVRLPPGYPDSMPPSLAVSSSRGIRPELLLKELNEEALELVGENSLFALVDKTRAICALHSAGHHHVCAVCRDDVVDDDEGDEDDADAPICTECFHFFHADCLAGWFINQRKARDAKRRRLARFHSNELREFDAKPFVLTCPECRRELTDLRRIREAAGDPDPTAPLLDAPLEQSPQDSKGHSAVKLVHLVVMDTRIVPNEVPQGPWEPPLPANWLDSLSLEMTATQRKAMLKRRELLVPSQAIAPLASNSAVMTSSAAPSSSASSRRNASKRNNRRAPSSSSSSSSSSGPATSAADTAAVVQHVTSGVGLLTFATPQDALAVAQANAGSLTFQSQFQFSVRLLTPELAADRYFSKMCAPIVGKLAKSFLEPDLKQEQPMLAPESDESCLLLCDWQKTAGDAAHRKKQISLTKLSRLLGSFRGTRVNTFPLFHCDSGELFEQQFLLKFELLPADDESIALGDELPSSPPPGLPTADQVAACVAAAGKVLLNVEPVNEPMLHNLHKSFFW